MAGKLPNPKDKGRCSRCNLSALLVEISPGVWEESSKMTKRVKHRRQHLYCTKYKKACYSVAWNCTEIA